MLHQILGNRPTRLIEIHLSFDRIKIAFYRKKTFFGVTKPIYWRKQKHLQPLQMKQKKQKNKPDRLITTMSFIRSLCHLLPIAEGRNSYLRGLKISKIE